MAPKRAASSWIKGIYWGATGLLSAMMVFSAMGYFTAENMMAAFEHLGFPAYFRMELGVAKLLGVIVLLIPGQLILKEWAYAGFSITFISAFIAHTSVSDPLSAAFAPLVALALLMVSYFTFKRARTG